MSRDEAEDRRQRRVQEVQDTRQRVRLGGLFYVAGWAVVAGFSDVPRAHPGPGLAIGAAFLALAALRGRPSPPGHDAPEAALVAWLDRQWTWVLATAALWGGVLCWALLDPHFADARTVALLCTIAYATAFAHNFAMRRDLALLGIAFTYLPAPVLTLADEYTPGIPITLAVYAVYLLFTVFRSHAEYGRHLDVDEALRHQRDRYEQLSRTDPLTGLANRRHFGGALEHLVREARRTGRPLSMLVMDLDHFKRVNDELGHDAGDACLVRLAERMREVLGAPGVHLSRLGGEEFGALLPGTGADEAAHRAEALRASLDQVPLALREGPRRVTISIGVASLAPTGEGDVLYQAADRAMYAAKAAGRNRVHVAR